MVLRNISGKLSPVRYEVTLAPGVILDASKYVIVEQRGDIYVIEEREDAKAEEATE